jgi:short-subunit dehydrogenase
MVISRLVRGSNSRQAQVIDGDGRSVCNTPVSDAYESERKDAGMASSVRPVALVTGASAGIGAALAREAANDGHDLVLVARRREPMEALAAELKSTGAEITVIPADLGKPGAGAALMKTVEERGLVIDTLINNAGFGDTGRFDQEDPERILSMLQVNVVALTELTRLVLPQMVARKRGKVMLLASTASFLPGPGMAVYYATKSYVLSFGRAIGYELRGTGVTVTTLCPGPTTSDCRAILDGVTPALKAARTAFSLPGGNEAAASSTRLLKDVSPRPGGFLPRRFSSANADAASRSSSWSSRRLIAAGRSLGRTLGRESAGAAERF